MLNTWKDVSVNVKGVIFLLGYSLLSAILNYLNSIAQSNTVPGKPPLWIAIIGWTFIVLFYLPIYAIFLHSVRRWSWSLDEWGFNLHGRAWISNAGAILGLVGVWLLLHFEWGNLSFFEVDATQPQMGVSLLLFQGYARVAEELLYRGLALVLFQRLFSNSPCRSLWAVLLSSACFTLVHTHRPSMLMWLFVSSVLLAAIVLWTRSLALAFAIHSAAGLHIGMLYAIIVYSGVAFFNERSKHLRESERSQQEQKDDAKH